MHFGSTVIPSYFKSIRREKAAYHIHDQGEMYFEKCIVSCMTFEAKCVRIALIMLMHIK